MGFYIDEDGVAGGILPGRRCRSENCNPDRSNEEDLGDENWKEFRRSICGKRTTSLTDC